MDELTTFNRNVFINLISKVLSKINNDNYYHIDNGSFIVIMSSKDTLVLKKQDYYSIFVDNKLNEDLVKYPIFEEIGKEIINMKLNNPKIKDNEIISNILAIFPKKKKIIKKRKRYIY